MKGQRWVRAVYCLCVLANICHGLVRLKFGLECLFFDVCSVFILFTFRFLIFALVQ